MTLEPSKRKARLTEEYHLGKLRVPDYEAGGRMDIGILVLYTKDTDELKREPIRECARFKADQHHSYFSGSSIYSGYVKYTNEDGSLRRKFLTSRDEEVDPKKLPDPTIVDTKRWDEEMVALIDQLPEYVRDLFRFF